MRSFSPHSPSNGEATPSPAHNRRDRLSPPPHPLFQSTLSVQKLRRLNWLALTLRLAAFCFSLASAVFMVTNSRDSSSPRWYDFDAYRYMVAANSIVTLYSLLELGISVWEMARNTTLFPEILQVWFDFGHDQVFAYMQVSAGSAGTALAKTMKKNKEDTVICGEAFCVQAEIAIGLGFVGFMFLSLSSLLSGFRLACFIIKGSRIHL